MNYWGHFKTITHHKLLVMSYCFRVGLIKQGLLHDLSKYAPTEFLVGARYYSGTRSPNAAERDRLGYSTAWLHHKGRNKHHLEYWIDYGGPNMELMGNPMPTKYMVELCLDRISACRVYHGDAYTDRDPLDYFDWSNDAKMLHPQTRVQVVKILTMLAEEGEEKTLQYIRKEVLKNPVRLFENRTDPAGPGELAEKDALFVEEAALEELARKYGTPFYLYDAAGIAAEAEKIREAFSWNPGHRQFFPVKATPTAGILKLLRAHGQGVVCSSAAELSLCRKCGFQRDEILFLPNYPTDQDLRTAAELGCMPVLDGPDQLRQFREYGLLSDTVGVRLIPERPFRFGSSEARASDVKFGMTVKQLKELIPQLKAAGVRSLGLHAYLAGNTLEQNYYPRLAEFLREAAEAVQNELPVGYINLSGGIGIPYMPGQRPVDLGAAAAGVREVLKTLPGMDSISIYTELGRSVTGPGGVLVTRVTSVKKGMRSYAGVDASASDLMRPMLYGAYHHVTVCGKGKDAERSKWDVVGSVCENTDKFAVNRMLPDLQPGDLLVIQDAGAHGHSMGYNYGGRLRCAEYLLQPDGSSELLRRAETTEDYLRTQIF